MNFLRSESDFFVGRRGRLKRYLVCSMQGYFPVAVKTGPNSLAAVFRTGGTHINISGTLAVSKSGDGGKSWSDPAEVAPRWNDVRNPAFGVNEFGELVLAYWKSGDSVLYEETKDGKIYSKNDFQDKELPEQHNVYTIRSSDGGETWTEPVLYDSEFLSMYSPFGRIITAPDGTLLMPAYGKPRNRFADSDNISILVRSRDGGKSWGDESLVAEGFNETSFAFLGDGTLVAAARKLKNEYVAVLFSKDMGRTWTDPIQVTRDREHPADLTLLQSGKLLMTFGRRIRPMGCGALISGDGGKSWNRDKEILLAGDGIEL